LQKSWARTPNKLRHGEAGKAAPTVRQARILADFYDRAFLEFFLPEPPVVSEPKGIPDFRMQAGIVPPADDREVLEIQRWTATQRVNALDLFDEVGEEPPELPAGMFSTLVDRPEQAAAVARELLNFPIEQQLNLPADEDALPAMLRQKLESLGVLTLRLTELKRFGIRGICLAEFPLPVVVFRDEAPSAQAFTLAHELGHVLIKQSGITGSRQIAYETNPVEKWCDTFAASFLMPRSEVERTAGKVPKQPADEFADARLAELARFFRVSPHAMLIRLVHLGYVKAAYYWETKKPEFDAQERQYRRFGRPQYYGVRYKNRLGELYTNLVLEAWAAGRITNHNAAQYMGIKNLRHLFDIRDHARAS
jgi:Zn-dependent peptidase ImmA (M78 family)